jgi:tetratricopeptide (TPR) repeat protein
MMLLVFASVGVFPLPALCAPETPPDTVMVERRPFRGFVRRDMAERTAKLAANLAAWEQAARLLAKEPDLHFINADNITPPPLDGLARMLFSTRIEALGMEGFPPHQQAIVKVSLVPPENLRKSLLDALPRQDLLELYAQVTAAQRSLLERYDHLSARLLPLNPATDGGQEENHRLKSIVNELIALDLYIELLPEYNHNWAAPEKAQPQLMKAERLAPNNPLILTALAEIFLQMDRPVSALEYVERALNQTPDFARGHDVKGAILLRKRLPSLAAESFGKAIASAPRNPVYYMHRASAYLVLEEENGMCRDFKSACGLGDCDGLQWAKSVGRCEAEQP